MSEPIQQPDTRVGESAALYRTQSEDTSVWADRLLFEHLSTLDARDTALQIAGACRMLEVVLRAGLRRDHPGADEAELDLRAAVQKYGPDVVSQLTGLALPH